ncbi:MAG: glutaredoxin domain-containing protein [Acidobacteria bacterium]|nr:glutaredoxin domain-containing protein [Acidobacteriota bacterium]
MNPVKMYTTRWCGDCWRAKHFLKSNGIEFKEINIDQSKEAAELVMEHNQGKRRVPTFEIDGAFYGNPPLRELGRLVGAG